MPNLSLESRFEAYLVGSRDALPPSFVVVTLECTSLVGVTPTLELRDIMIATADHVMSSQGGVFAYVHGAEISVLIAADRRVGDRVAAHAAGDASAKATLLLGALASFGACWWRFPDRALAGEFFRWRYEVATSCPVADAEQLPRWRWCGVALWWQQLSAPGLTGLMSRRVRVELELPELAEYVELVQRELRSEPQTSA